MPCEPFRSADGRITGFLCSRGGRRQRCSACKTRWATKLCDFPLAGKRAGDTCSKPLCDRCASQPANVQALPERFIAGTRFVTLEGDSFDLCPAHAALVAKENA